MPRPTVKGGAGCGSQLQLARLSLAQSRAVTVVQPASSSSSANTPVTRVAGPALLEICWGVMMVTVMVEGGRPGWWAEQV